jgi:hypothetical protein
MHPAYAWSPSKKDSINKVETVQRRAARFATEDYQRTSIVTAMLQQLQWQTPQSRRAYAQTVMIDRDHMGSRLHTHHRYQVYQTLTYRCTGLFEVFFIPNKSGRLDKAVKLLKMTFCQ